MDLIVRTQDRMAVMRIENFGIDKEDKTINTVIYGKKEDVAFVLGEYKTVEHCQQVFDSIISTLKFNSSAYVFFEMPSS